MWGADLREGWSGCEIGIEADDIAEQIEAVECEMIVGVNVDNLLTTCWFTSYIEGLPKNRNMAKLKRFRRFS